MGVEVLHSPEREDDRSYRVDFSKIAWLLGFKPQRAIPESVLEDKGQEGRGPVQRLPRRQVLQCPLRVHALDPRRSCPGGSKPQTSGADRVRSPGALLLGDFPAHGGRGGRGLRPYRPPGGVVFLMDWRSGPGPQRRSVTARRARPTPWSARPKPALKEELTRLVEPRLASDPGAASGLHRRLHRLPGP